MIKNKKWLALALVIVLAAAAIAGGCASTTSNKPGGGAGGTPQKVYTLKIATMWPDSILLHKMPVEWARICNEASGGRLKIEVYPAGAIVGAGEVLDATKAGTIDGYHDWPGYWIGKMPASPFFAAVPMYMEPFMHVAWMYEGGGLEFMQKMFDQSGYNVKLMLLGVTHPEQLAVSNKPMQTFDDFKGLKYRTVGWWGEILRSIGVAVTSVPGAEVYPGLERGIIDAAEFSTPAVNKVLGFQEVTKYVTGPGMHQPSCLFSIGINKKKWDELPKDLQLLMESTARSVTLWSWTRDLQESMDAVESFEKKGIKKVTAAPEVQKKLYEETIKLLDEKARKEGGIFQEIWTSMKNYRQKYIEYEEFMMPIRIK